LHHYKYSHSTNSISIRQISGKQHRDFINCPLCGSVARQPFPQSIRRPHILQLLQCNDVPTDAELSCSQEIVKKASGHIAELDERIADARKTRDALLSECISIEEDSKDARVLSSPVRRLPPDVFRAISLETILSPFQTMSRSDYYNSLDHKNSPWMVSQVCHGWRLIIVSSPELWSSMSLILSNHFSSSIFCQMFMLGRR
ncbi:uncharacterized protein BT62DRAFT_159010, partial [Guyanagaster necrorhizus]